MWPCEGPTRFPVSSMLVAGLVPSTAWSAVSNHGMISPLCLVPSSAYLARVVWRERGPCGHARGPMGFPISCMLRAG